MEQTVRYRYRAYPTAVQEQSLKRLFGCCRVVWNDTVCLFRKLFDPNGRMPSSAALQKKVLADAKRTEERAWLAEVANVPLLQMHRDALRACWNGVRKTQRQRRARYRSLKRNPVNSARFTANGFRLRDNGRLYLAKIGDLKIKWSRDLPSTPSSCTIILEADGSWYVSFVVRRETTPLPAIPVSNAIDLGFNHLGSLVDTDGNRRRIPAPKPLNQTPAAAGESPTEGSTPTTRLETIPETEAEDSPPLCQSPSPARRLPEQAGAPDRTRNPSDRPGNPQRAWHEPDTRAQRTHRRPVTVRDETRTEGAAVRQADPAYRKIPAVHTPLLAMRAPRERRNTRKRPRMEMRGMPHHPRPRLQRGPEHTRRGRACRVAKRARRQCKTPSRHGGTKQQSRKREPPAPQRCRNLDALAPGGSQLFDALSRFEASNE